MYKKTETIIEKLKQIIKDVVFKENFYINETGINRKSFNPEVEKTRNQKFGDFSTNFLAKTKVNKSVIDDYKKIFVAKFSKFKKYFEKVEFVEPSFINFTLAEGFLQHYIFEIIDKKDECDNFNKKKTFYNLEFVSANPTGLLHLGHARNAAYGDTLVNIWKKYGISVNKEFYINDGGGQIEKLAQSVHVRYLQLFDVKAELPEDAYHGQEIITVATALRDKYGDKFLKGHKLDGQNLETVKLFATGFLLNIIKQTLEKFGVVFDIWFSESIIYKENIIPVVLKSLEEYAYTNEGALFLKTTKFGDDKDRVLIKSDGSYTYFTPDIAYHSIKLQRGYDKLFNIWGADHASYVQRMRIAIKMLGSSEDKLTVLIQQMVKLTKDGQEFKMSKRSGNSLTLQDMLDTIGKDAARWYLVSTTLDSHIDIDVDKVTQKDANNPLYYVQYAHARINQIINKNLNIKCDNKSLDLLNLPIEREIKCMLAFYKHTIQSIAENYEVHRLCNYLQQLSKLYHSYYTSNKIINETNLALSGQRLTLSIAVKQVLTSGLKLLSIPASEKM